MSSYIVLNNWIYVLEKFQWSKKNSIEILSSLAMIQTIMHHNHHTLKDFLFVGIVSTLIKGFFLQCPKCHNLSLRLTTKAKACESAGQEGGPRDTSYTPRSAKKLREWALTLSSELPLGELESQWIPESSRSNYRGQNPLDWKVLYIIRKLLNNRCLKWACVTHLDIWNTSYG